MPMFAKQNDELLKGVLEIYFEDFLRFLLPEADDIFDFRRSIEFLNTELALLQPQRGRSKGKRIADMLAKVYLKSGQEKWILVHTEIEGASQKDFAFRLFQYYYRLVDKNKVPVDTIVIYTGGMTQKRPNYYMEEGFFSRVYFSFLGYHIFDHQEEELFKMGSNIFALVILACQKAFLEGHLSDVELGAARLRIAERLLKQRYNYAHVKSFMIFLKNFLYIESEVVNGAFDAHLYKLTGGGIKMDLLEIVTKQAVQRATTLALEKGKQAGLEEGKLAGLEEGKLVGLEEGKLAGLEEGKLAGLKEGVYVVASEMKRAGIPLDEIARFTKLSIDVLKGI